MASFTTPEADFLPEASFRLTDATIYAQVLADYGIAGNGGLLYGVSPQTLATRYGIPWTDNPTTTDYSNLTPIGRVFTTTAAAASQVLGNVVSGGADGVQTLVTPYTDPHGYVHTSVTWEWLTEVVLYSVASDQDTWDQQVVTWTGDGTSNRLIPTTFDLTTHPTFVWVFPTATQAPSFRHSGMAGTTISAFPPTLTGGIMAFQSGGFTVTDDGISSCRVNTNLNLYSALVVRASSKYMALASWTGLGALSTSGIFSIGSAVASVTSGLITAVDIGRVVTVGGVQSMTILSVAGSNVTFTTPSTLAGSQTITNAGGGQTITFAGPKSAPTIVLVFGRSGQTAFYTEDMPAGRSHSMGVEPQVTTNQITAAGYDVINNVAFINVGANSNVNNAGLTIYGLVICLPVADPARSLIHTYKVVGTGSNIPATGFGFTPAIATMRVFDATLTASVVRTPQDSLATSRKYDGTGVTTPNSIVSMDADGDTIGSSVVGLGNDGYGIAVKSSGASSTFSDPTTSTPSTLTNPDGSSSSISDPSTAPFITPGTREDGDPQWWCNATFGYSVWQIDSPGDGWIACAGPVSDNGWYLSVNDFASTPVIISAGIPADPRPWAKLASWAAGGAGPLGGSPGASALVGNRLIYPASGYTVATDYPPIRVHNGRQDRELCRLPPTSAAAIPRAVISMLAANGTVYLTTWDSGTTSSTFAGRVFQLDQTTGVLTVLGTGFSGGEMPYALEWHMGRLWCGTNNSIGTVGKIYFIRPGIDTDWTLDHATSTDSAGGVDSLASFQGKLYVGTDNAAASRGKVLIRDTAGAYTTSRTGSGGTAAVNNGYLQMSVFLNNLYASYWNPDSTVISKVEKFDGSSWSLVYTGISTSLKPTIQFAIDDGTLFMFGGSLGYAASIVSTVDGTSWVDLTAELLPDGSTHTLVPTFGAVVM